MGLAGLNDVLQIVDRNAHGATLALDAIINKVIAYESLNTQGKALFFHVKNLLNILTSAKDTGQLCLLYDEINTFCAH